MPMLPIPAFVALVLGYLALRTFLSQGRPLLVTFLAACALQSGMVALVGGYGIDWLRFVLPISASFIPPLAWVTFQDALVSRFSAKMMTRHLATPAFTLFCRAFVPETTDVVVSLVFAGYGAAILVQLRSVSDMPLARLEAGHVPMVIWQILGWALIASASIDVLIAVAFATGNGEWTGWMITVSSSLVLLVVGMLSGSPSASGTGDDEPPKASASRPETSQEDIDIVAKLEDFLNREPMHLDPNLTLARLARRLHLPEKRLSMAVNRATGRNVSRYVNSWRIRHACAQIEGGMSVTQAMLESGFNTKSNFNREFLRETGVAPSKWSDEFALKSKVSSIGQTKTALKTGC